MSTPNSPAEVAERLQRRRVRVMWLQGLLFMLWQTNFFTSPHGDFAQLRNVDQVKISAFVVWAAAMLVLIATGGGWLRSKEVRALLNDESTQAHRRFALMVGYWAAMLAALALYVTSLFTQLRLVEAIHIVLSAGVIAPLLTFAHLERRALRA